MNLKELCSVADYKDSHGLMFNGNCLEVMNKMDDASVDLIVTDPPYLMNFQSNHRKVGYRKIEGDTWGGQQLIKDYLRECNRILKDNTAIYCFCSWHHIDFFKQEFEKYFKLKNILIWEKNNTSMGDLKGSYAPKYEMILFGHKGRRLLNGFRYPDVIQAKRTGNKFHPTEKPVDLLKIFIESNSDEGQVVFDGFGGSGSTCVAARELNRKFIGCELDKDYFDIAVNRLKG